MAQPGMQLSKKGAGFGLSIIGNWNCCRQSWAFRVKVGITLKGHQLMTCQVKWWVMVWELAEFWY